MASWLHADTVFEATRMAAIGQPHAPGSRVAAGSGTVPIAPAGTALSRKTRGGKCCNFIARAAGGRTCLFAAAAAPSAGTNEKCAARRKK